MVLLRTAATRPVSTVRHLRELDATLSRQREVLYGDLARRMSDLGHEPARHAFEHALDVLRDERPKDTDAEVAIPAVFHDEDLGSTRLASPYAAYSLAVRNQERAFAFWTHVSAHSPDRDVRSEAERLARRELERVKALRASRRKSYHASRPTESWNRNLQAETVQSFSRRAGEMEAALADLHERISAKLAESGDPRAEAMSTAAKEEREIAQRFGSEPAAHEQTLPHDPDALMALATERLESAIEFYLAAAEAGQREDVVSAAQDLAERGLRRLSRLR